MPCLSVLQCTNLQPLVDGLSCSELSKLNALELLGGDGLWEFELKERNIVMDIWYILRANGKTDVCFRAATLTSCCIETNLEHIQNWTQAWNVKIWIWVWLFVRQEWTWVFEKIELVWFQKETLALLCASVLSRYYDCGHHRRAVKSHHYILVYFFLVFILQLPPLGCDL